MSEYIDEDLTKKENVLDIIVSRLESQKERALFLIKDMFVVTVIGPRHIE